jgi:hypothetical protein
MSLRVMTAAWIAAAALAASTASAAGGGALEEMCPHYSAPNPSCVTEPIPGEGWTVSGMHPPARSALRRYRKLVPHWFSMPRRPMVGFVAARLNVPGVPPTKGDPPDGYMEEAVMIRVRHGREGGWFPLATAVNDSSQYSSGRWVGIPKYMADEHIRHDHRAGRWTFTALPPGGKRGFMRLAWTRARYRASKRHGWTPTAAERSMLRRLTLYDDPMFTTVRPWDVADADRFPERVKFTISPYLPSSGAAPGGGLQRRPAPRAGTTRVSVSQTIGPKSLRLWRSLVRGDRRRAVPGLFWHGAGWVFVSSERLDGKPGPPGKP